MKKITLPDFERNHVKKTNRWLGWLSLCFLVLIGSNTMTFGQGNTCVAPLVVTTLPYTHTGNTATYGNDYTQTNVPATAPGAVTTGTGTVNYMNGFDVVYSITPIINGTISVNTTNDDGWQALWAFTGCPFSSRVGYHTAISGTTRSIANLPVIANTTYYLVFSSWDPPGVNYTINVTGTPGLLTPLTDCTGIPNAGTASLTPNSGNAGSVFTANVTGVSLASGLTYQWQRNIGGTWQNIAGATTLSSQITAENGAVGTSTDYRLAVTCTASTEVAYSSIATFTVALTYCVPTGAANNADEIRNFTLNNLNNNSAASDGVAGYKDYSGLVAPAQLSLTTPYIATVTSGTGSGNHGAAIWIDYDKNGTFDASEKVAFIGNTIGPNATASFPEFTIPTGTPLGIYRLRVQYHFNKSGDLLDPCTITSTFAETEDYSVQVLAAPTCSQPTTLTASNVASNSADLSWSSTGSLFDIEWGTQGFVQGTGTIINGITLPSYSLNTLTPNTSYSYYVRQNCGATDGLSLWSGPFNFKTICGTLTTFTENFDSYTLTGAANPLPDCWTRFGNTGSSYITTGSATPLTPPNRLYLSASATGPTNATAVMPPVSNLQAETHRLKFKGYCTTAGKSVEIGYYEIANDATSFIVLETFEMPSTAQTTATEFIYTPEFVPAGIQSIAFRVNGGAFTGTTTMYIDDVIWEAIPLCADITDIEISNVTANTADILWTIEGTEIAWDYVYGVSTVTDPNTLTPTTVNNIPYVSLEGLTANTNYKLWIRSNCGNGIVGNWSTPQTFTTQCSPVTTFSENFDSSPTGTTSLLPPCWMKAGNGSTYLTTGGVAPGTPPNRMYMFANGVATTPTESIAIMPAVSNLAAGTHRLKFRAYATAADKTIEIGYYSDASDLSSYSPLQTINITTTTAATAAVYSYIPVGVPDGVTKFAFRNAGLPASTTLYIDDVVWEPIPLCPDVNTVNFIGATATTASISWIPGGSETAWEYVYDVATTTDPSALTPFEVLGTPETVITSLLPSTTYKVWVRSKCGNDLGAFSSPITFLTACLPISTLPWTEGFEGITTVGLTAFPPCWSKQNGDWASAVAGTYNTPRTGTKYIRNSWTATNEFMWTPGFEMVAGTSYDFSFHMQGDGFTGWNVDVFYNTVQNSTNAIQLGSTVTASGTGTIAIQPYQLVNNTFVPTTSGVYYFAVRVNQASGTPWYIAFDDFKVELSPNCVAPTVQAATNVTSSSATLNWTSPFTPPADGYEYLLTTNATLVPDATTVPTGSVVAGITLFNETNLLPTTTYRYYVRSVCSSTDKSSWSSPSVFTTPCVAITTLPWNEGFEGITTVGLTAFPPCWFKQNGDWASAVTGTYNTPRTGTKYIRNSWAATNEFIWTPGFEMTAGTSYDFSFYMQGDGGTGWNVDVFYNTVQNSTDAIQLGSTATPSGSGTIAIQTYQLVNNTFVPATTGIYYFAVRVNQPSSAPWYIAFDDFKVDLSPSCVPPVVSQATNITTSTATINWVAPFSPPANGYEYFYTTSANLPDSSTIPSGSVAAGITTANLTGLTSSTVYRFYVRAVCSTSDSSTWAQGPNFTTSCDTSPLPYTIDFESATVPNLPLCTSNQNVGTGNNWITANNPGSGFTNKTLRYTYNLTFAANTWFYTNSVNLVAGTSYSISYKYGTNSTTLYTENLKVAYGVTANSTDMTNAIADHPGISGTTPQNNLVIFTPTVSGNYVFGFHAYSAADQNSLFLDDIVIQENLSSVEFNNNKFTAYPNPVKNNLNIRYNENISNVTVFNLLGQQVITKNINATEGQVDMSTLASGTYLVKVNSGDKVETIKVIKE